MELELGFELSDEQLGATLKGKLIRKGSVLQDASGATMALVREVWPRPLPMDLLSTSMPEVVQGALALSNPVGSILNLGATVAFGAATVSKLNSIGNDLNAFRDEFVQHSEELNGKLSVVNDNIFAIGRHLCAIDMKLDSICSKLDEVMGRLDQLQWSIELGFAATLQTLDDIRQFQEFELLGRLQSAADMAWRAQFIEPGDPQRSQRLENAFGTAVEVASRLMLHARDEMERSIVSIKSRKKGQALSIDGTVVKALRRFRHSCLACDLAASIGAEFDELPSVIVKLEKECNQLFSLLQEFGTSFVSFNETEFYATALNNHFDNLPISRVLSWACRFDECIGSERQFIKVVRSACKSRVSKLAKQVNDDWASTSSAQKQMARISPSLKKKELQSLTEFVHAFDGAIEDFQRLEGHLHEYRTAKQLGIPIAEHRTLVQIENVPEQIYGGLAFFTLGGHTHEEKSET